MSHRHQRGTDTDKEQADAREKIFEFTDPAIRWHEHMYGSRRWFN